MKITRNTKIKDVLSTPSGHDIIARVLYAAGLDENLLKGILGNFTIGGIKRLTLGKIGDSFIDSLLEMLNSETETVPYDDCEIKKEWWKEAVFYEIYPRSFKDSNNDGIGDIPGIIEKLDYLKDLGVDALWIAPFYDSPNADNGYDIRDYKKVMEEFGTMKDIDKLFNEAHKRNIKVIIDLVMNHTSDEHEWFIKSKNNDPKYKDFYIWKKSENIPNNWTSLFSGPAWKYYDERKEWALHLFAEKQIDLNWENPEVRKNMQDVATFWLEKGADGFRIDVISFISKADGLPDGDETLGSLIAFTGIEHYFHGPHLDEYLNEFNDKVFNKYNAYTVGECPGNGVMMSKLITGDDRNELTQVFSFDHIDNPGHVRIFKYNFDIRKMIPELVRWQTQYSNHCWPTVFFDNHDNPRMVSKVVKDGPYLKEAAKMLATIQFTLKGTPYMYQGCEIGMPNTDFTSIDEFKDVESLNAYKEMLNRGFSKEKSFSNILWGSRDHARTPVNWSDDIYGGFSTHEPWIKTNQSYKEINVESQLSDKDSVLNYTKDLIHYRKAHKSLIYGSFRQLKANRNFFVYEREDDEKYLIIINLTDKTRKYPVKPQGELIKSNYTETSDKLRPYEANIYKIS